MMMNLSEVTRYLGRMNFKFFYYTCVTRRSQFYLPPAREPYFCLYSPVARQPPFDRYQVILLGDRGTQVIKYTHVHDSEAHKGTNSRVLKLR